MKKLFTIVFLFFVVCTLSAQNYSACYTSNMSKGNDAYSQGRYSEAKNYYATAKKCAGGNPTEAQKKINACNAKLGPRNCTAVTDNDQNTYRVVQIGAQCWMAENLKTTHYADGTLIPLGLYRSSTKAYWYYPNGDAKNKATFGLLYNWAAVMNGSPSSNNNPSGVQGICPDGWHVPSNNEWTQLIDYLKEHSNYQCDDESDIAKALADKNNWQSSSVYCSVGNNTYENNATGFSAVPAGYFYDTYKNFKVNVDYWSSTKNYNYSNAVYSRGIYFSSSEVRYDTGSYDDNACSVRCLKD